MAQPPGSETRAKPWRASSGPSTRTLARIVLTRSYGASKGELGRARRSTMAGSAAGAVAPGVAGAAGGGSSPLSMPRGSSRRAMVRRSRTFGTRCSRTGSSGSRDAGNAGRAAVFAPLARTRPASAVGPVMTNLSMARPRSLSRSAPPQHQDTRNAGVVVVHGGELQGRAGGMVARRRQLAVADLENHPGTAMQRRARVDQAAQDGLAAAGRKECQVRLEIANLRRQGGKLGGI